MALNNAYTKTNSSDFRSMLEKHQLTGPNFNEWFRALKLVVHWAFLFDRHNEVACLMLGTMSPKLYQQFEHNSPLEMVTELQKIYGKPPGYPKETVGYYFYYPPKNKIVVERYADLLEKDFVLQKESGRIVELEDEDNLPSENTSEHPIKEGSLAPIIDPDRLCFNVEVEEHSLRDLNEPANYNAALLDLEFEKWLVAMNAKMQSMYDNKVWRLVVLPPNAKVVKSKWIYKKKMDMDGKKTFSHVADIRAIRILIAIAAYYDYEIWQIDVKTVFLNGFLEEEIYMEQPKGFIDPIHPRKVCNLQRSIYRLKQALRRWNKRFDEEIKRFGFHQNLDEPCVYQKASGSNVIFLILYVDDIILMRNHIGSLQEVKTYLGKCFSMKDLGEAAFILGIKIYRDRSRRLIGLSQNAYLDKILKRYRMDNSKRGSIPTEAHWTAVKNILKYLRNSKDTFLVSGGDPEAELRVNCYCDARFETDKDDMKSQTGYVCVLNGGVVVWKNSKQSTTIQHATEAECIAASKAAKEAVWIRKFIDELGVVPSNDYPIKMNCDSSAAIIMAKESGIQKGAKHFKRKYHYVREVSYYTDVGYLMDVDDLKSHTGYVFVLNGGAVDWKSTKQSIFATSSIDAEYIAAFNASKEAVWIRKFISGLGVVPIIEEPINMKIPWALSRINQMIAWPCPKVEDKLSYLEQPIPAMSVPLKGQVLPPDVLNTHSAWVKASKEIAGLMLMTMDPDIQKNLEQLGAYDLLKELKMLVQKNQKKKPHKAAKGNQGKANMGYAHVLAPPFTHKPKNPLTPKKDYLAKNAICHQCCEVGHQSRNYLVYLVKLMKKKKLSQGASTSDDSSMYDISNKRAKLNLVSTLLWHCRFGHINKKRIEKLQQDGLLDSTEIKSLEKCVSCMSGKMARKPYSHQLKRVKYLLGLIHTDVCGPFRTMSRQGASYFVTFTDDFSRYGYVYLLKHKHEVFETFKVFQKEVENQLEKTIKSPRSNRGGEYMSQEFLDYLKEHEIIAHRTPPYMPQFNGVSERRNRTLLDMNNLITQKSSGSLEDLEINQEKDTHPSIDTSLNYEEDDQEINDPQSDINHIHKSTRTRRAPDRMCLHVDAEEHELGDLDEPTNYKATLLDPESDKWLIAMNVEIQSMRYNEEKLHIFLESRSIEIDQSEKLKLSKSQGASTPAKKQRMQNVPYASVVGSIMLGVVPTIEELINMYCDNTGAIAISKDHGVTKGARYFRAKVYYFCETIEMGDAGIEKVDTNDNLADPYTKALAFLKHSKLTKKIGMAMRVVLDVFIVSLNAICYSNSQVGAVGICYKYMAQVVKTDGHIVNAIGLLKQWLNNVQKNDVCGIESWQMVIKEDIDSLTALLKIFEQENEFPISTTKLQEQKIFQATFFYRSQRESTRNADL
uniref:Integrase catalytic domain-containing protein n=1 Tax=Tanacetum cinerariifolium TaxID=118510 RepID=A0A6L2MQV8_TANCI|nr:hypothetical protein [Tanacetum cinerariifolium]